jgi:hypothetical protein
VGRFLIFERKLKIPEGRRGGESKRDENWAKFFVEPDNTHLLFRQLRWNVQLLPGIEIYRRGKL